MQLNAYWLLSPVPLTCPTKKLPVLHSNKLIKRIIGKHVSEAFPPSLFDC